MKECGVSVFKFRNLDGKPEVHALYRPIVYVYVCQLMLSFNN